MGVLPTKWRRKPADRDGTKLRRCHPMYTTLHVSDTGASKLDATSSVPAAKDQPSLQTSGRASPKSLAAVDVPSKTKSKASSAMSSAVSRNGPVNHAEDARMYNQSINQSCIFRVVQVIKSLQDPLEVGNNLPGINDNVTE